MNTNPCRARRVALTMVVCLACSVVAAAPAAGAGADPVSRWAQRHAVRVPPRPDSPGPDLAVVGRATRDAAVVGLGEGAHEIREVTNLKIRYLKYLVVRRGFRAVGWEDDWSLGTEINEYVHGQRDDVRALVLQMSTAWHTREVVGLLRWMRRYNAGHAADVDFVGTEFFATRPVAYDAVEDFVARYAPGRLPALRTAFDLLKPPNDDMATYLQDYLAIPDKRPYVRAARHVVDLIDGIHRGTASERALALHNAVQIRSFYVGFSLPYEQIAGYRDARAAENVAWARDYTGSRLVYWAQGAHVADAGEVTITAPGQPDTVFTSAGSYLADRYGARYVTIGFTFDRGTALDDAQQVVTMPPAAPTWFEAPLGDVGCSQFVLDLRRPAPRAVRDWLDLPVTTRGYPEYGYRSTISGGPLRDWYDLLVHRQVVTAATPLD